MRDVDSADFSESTFDSCTTVRVVCSGPLTCYSTLWLAPLSRSTYTILSMFSLGKSVVENNFLVKSRSTHTLQPKPRTARHSMVKCTNWRRLNGACGAVVVMDPLCGGRDDRLLVSRCATNEWVSGGMCQVPWMAKRL